MESTRGQSNSVALVSTAVRDIGVGSDVHDFMEQPAPWLLRSGSTVLAGVMCLLLVLSVVIKYPDTITARITITGTQPVAEVVARQSGQLESLRVREGQSVRKGDVLAVIRNPSRSTAVLALGNKLLQTAPALLDEVPSKVAEFAPEEGLGSIQDPYSEFLNAYHKLRDRLADDYSSQAGALLREQLTAKEAQIESLRSQTKTAQRELELARMKYQRSKTLHGQGLISTADLQEQEAALLQQTRADTTAQRALSEAQIEAAKLKKELRDLNHEYEEALRTAREQVRGTLNKLQGAIAVWDAEYVLRAPANGAVAFYDFWSDQQYVTANRQVFLVMPEVLQLLGRIAVNQGGAGKIKAGQPVRIRLDDFPYKEFGIVSGHVQSVSLVSRNGANLVLVDIPHPLTTSFRRQLQFKQDMTGEGRIVTEDIRLLERVLYEIRRAFVNNTR